MAPVSAEEQSPAMTTTEPNGERATRLLRRRSDDRIVGGVAAGIADYLDVDPVLIRAVFVGLMIFGGAGFVLYVLGWLLIPAGGEERSVAESFVRGLDLTPRGALFGALVIVGIVVLFTLVALPGGYDPGGSFYVDGRALVVLGGVATGIWILRRTAGGGSTSAAAAPPSPVARVAPAARAAKRPAQPRSPLGLYVVAAALIAVGIMALVANATNRIVTPGQFFGVAFTIVGVGLAVGGWWGRARWLMLPALLLLPFAWASAYLTAPIEGGIGDQSFAPVSAEELRDEYRLVGGGLTLDLRDVPGSGPIRTSASVAVGYLTVFLPEDASVQIAASVGAGETEILGNYQAGTGLAEHMVRGEGREIVLDLDAGIGRIKVYPQEVTP